MTVRVTVQAADSLERLMQISGQKTPGRLYRWILQNYARPGDRILDTHAGSGASCIACHEMGFDFLAFEIDPDYCRAATERLENVRAQIRFDELPQIGAEQVKLF